MNKAEYLVISDRSGSMSSNREEYEGAINSYIEKLRTQDGETNLSFIQFDNEVEILFESVPIEKVTEYFLQPRGMTSLMDAMAIGLNLMKGKVQPGVFVDVLVVTDGHENSSKEMTPATLRKLKEECEELGITISFIGAEFDAITEGAKFGYGVGQTLNAASGKFQDTFDTYAAKQHHARTVYSSTVADIGEADAREAARKAKTFTDEDRRKSGDL